MNSRNFGLLLLIVCLLGGGCTISPTPPTTNNTLFPTVTSTITISTTSTATMSDNLRLSPTPTLSPSTLTSTPLSTPTPVPTMTISEEYAFVLKMLQDDKTCRLPCWWGFTPEETSTQTVKNFFLTRGKKIWNYGDPQDFTIIFDLPNGYHNQVYKIRNGMIDTIHIHAVPPSRDYEHVYGDPQFLADWAPYLPSQLFKVYGPPEEIFIGVDLGTPWQPFDIVFFYPTQGILTQYSGPVIEKNELLQLCPYKTELELYLWQPGHVSTLGDLSGMGGYTYTSDDMSLLHTLSEVTSMTIAELVQETEQFDRLFCLETPRDLW